MHVAKFTEQWRQEELARGEKSLWYFGTAILGFDRWGEVQYDMCSFLEGRPPHLPWRSAVAAGYRGCRKSSVGTMTYTNWRCCYIPDFTAKWIENSSDNCKINHFLPLVELWVNSPRSDYLQWLFSHRLPANMEGWTSTQIQFKRDSPLGPPSITYWGMESKFEGWHGDLVVFDDPEGADAETSVAANDLAYRRWQQASPLLREPATGQVLGIMTIWGKKPTFYRLLDRERGGSMDDPKRSTKIWFMPLLDASGEPREPERFPPSKVAELQLDREVFRSQYQLQRPGEDIGLFQLDTIDRFAWEWASPRRDAVTYRYLSYEGEKLVEKTALWALDEMWYFLHCDPTHKLDELRRVRDPRKSRPSEAAHVLTAVAPDGNAIVADYWTGDVEIHKHFEKIFQWYVKWEARSVTWESIGAQIWLLSLAKALEERDVRFRFPESVGYLGEKRPLPKISRVMVEHEKLNANKEDAYRTILAAYLHRGVLHVGREQTKLRAQLVSCLDAESYLDLLDCLVQAPAAWKTPPAKDWWQRREGAQRFAAAAGLRHTGYRSPYDNVLPYTPRQLGAGIG